MNISWGGKLTSLIMLRNILEALNTQSQNIIHYDQLYCFVMFFLIRVIMKFIYIFFYLMLFAKLIFNFN